jgi:molecular chaperone DnaK
MATGMSRIIGIDLGTTNTCAGFVSNKFPRVIPIEGGYNLMPSVVSLHPSGTVLVGEKAREQMVAHPERTIHGVKRLLGRQFYSKTVRELQERIRYRIVAGPGGEAAVEVGGHIHSAVELQTEILRQVKRYAEIHLGEEIPEAVIAVPAYYTDHQRVLVKQAGTAAGFKVRRIVNEPTAAALAYGFNRGYDQKILIYDLGGGTFDVSVLELTGNVFQVMATGGDTYLGGADFDARIVEWLVESVKKQSKVDLREEPRAMQRVGTAAERAKIELSLLMNTQIRLPGLIERRGRPLDIELMLDRETLNQLTRSLVERTLEVVDAVLGTRNIDKHGIDELILVGGQTRMPLVNDLISAHFGKTPRKGVNPDECVAIGAALLGDSLAKIDAVTLLDTLSIPIGVALPNGLLQVVIDKHTPLPQTGVLELPTSEDGQSLMQIDIFQGEAGPVREAEYLGTLTCKNIPPAPAGTVKVMLELKLDAEGLLTITARHEPGGTPEVLQLATVERPTAKLETALPEPASAAAEEKAGIRGLVRNLWGAKKS